MLLYMPCVATGRSDTGKVGRSQDEIAGDRGRNSESKARQPERELISLDDPRTRNLGNEYGGKRCKLTLGNLLR